MRHPTRVLLAALLLATCPAPPAGAQEEPAPVPFIEREEVRFITLDIVAEERAGGWRPLRDLTIGQIEVRVGDRLMSVDQFENFCGPPAAGAAAPPGSAPATPAAPPDAPTTAHPGVPGNAAGPQHYILYFDMEHLDLAGRDAAFRAALAWSEERFDPADEVMIITGGRGLRIVRTFLPAGDRLRDDLESTKEDYRATELWGALESVRLWELRQEKNRTVRQMQADNYAQIDRSKARNSLSNLRDVMTIFDAVEGTKNLLLFSDTLRLVPGRQYGYTSTPLIDVQTELHDLAGAANERNVRIYPVKAGLPTIIPGSDPRLSLADSALTMLAYETGGRTFEGSNVVDGIFDQVAEDIACFYRVGFRIRPRYSGQVEPIRVQVVNRRSTVRLRYRQTLQDPTLEEIAADMIRAAFVAPTEAHAFPIAVKVTELFRREEGSRLQVEIGTPLGALLGLPAPTGRPGSRQVRVEIGARVVPLRPLEEDAAASSRRGVWADVATDRVSSGFGRQAVLTLPPPSRPDRSLDRVVATAEFEAPPGRYRIVGVIQDQLARTVSAAHTDLQLDADPDRLGPIGLASGDAHAVLLHDTSDGDPEQGPDGRRATDPTAGEHIPPGGKPARDASGWKGKDVALAPPLLPPGALLNEASVVEQSGPAHLYYSVCLQPPSKGRGARPAGGSSTQTPSGDKSTGDGWRLERILTCGSEETAVRLPPRSLAAPRKGVRCEPLIDSIPAAALRPGRCRFDLLLKGPRGEQEHGAREFTVVPPTARDATVTGSLRLPPDP